MAQTLKAVIFDYDGTLRDSKSAVYAAYEHAFTDNDLSVPPKPELDKHIHHHSFVHKALAPQLSEEEFVGSYASKVDQLLPDVGLYPKVAETLAGLRDKGYKIAMVTAAKDAAKYLKQTNIYDYFDILVTAKDITKHKPDPEGMNIALDRLGIAAAEAVYIGDMVTDIYAAQAAHLRAAIGVTYGFASRRELEQAGADYVIDSLDELTEIITGLETV